MPKTNIEKLCIYLKNNKERIYPINNDMLVSTTDFVLNGYMKMLGVILQQSSDITEAQLSIYKRLIAGTETEKKAEEYLRMALEVEVDDYENFILEIKKLPIKYRFILDAMILTCVDEKNSEQIKLVAEFAESLGIEKEDVRYLAIMAKAILCMDISAYVGANEMKKDNIPENVFWGYVRLMTSESIIKNENITIFQPTYEEDVTIEKLLEICNADTPCVKLSNVKVDISEYNLSFVNQEKVILDGCEFIGGNKYSIQFTNCKEVVIKNTSFKDFSVRTICLNNVTAMRIYKSSFEQCSLKYDSNASDWMMLGGVIYVDNILDNMDPILIEGCTFTNCGGRNSANWYRSAFISNYRCNVNESKFINCWHYSDTSIDPENVNRTMFPSRSEAIRCTYENSAAFC